MLKPLKLVDNSLINIQLIIIQHYVKSQNLHMNYEVVLAALRAICNILFLASLESNNPFLFLFKFFFFLSVFSFAISIELDDNSCLLVSIILRARVDNSLLRAYESSNELIFC
jgi:hypothetical protein